MPKASSAHPPVPLDRAPDGKGPLGGYLVAAILLPALLAVLPLQLAIRATGRGPALWLAVCYQLVTIVVWVAVSVPLVAWTRRETDLWLSGQVNRPTPVDIVRWLARFLGSLVLHAAVIALATTALHLGRPSGETQVEIEQSLVLWAPWNVFTFGWIFFLPFDLLTAGGVTVVAIVVAERRARHNMAARTDRLEQQLEEAHLHALRAQLEPHFLFNALGAATALARRNEGDAAAGVLVALSDLLRRVMDRATEPTTSVADEFEFIGQYLAIEHVRFGDRLSASVRAAPGTHDIRIPSLLVQPLVENAVKHGIASRESPGGVVTISAEVHDGMLVIEVVDNGGGPVDDTTTGLGLRATRERLRTRYGDRATLELLARTEGGAVARIRIPRDTAAAEGHDA